MGSQTLLLLQSSEDVQEHIDDIHTMKNTDTFILHVSFPMSASLVVAFTTLLLELCVCHTVYIWYDIYPDDNVLDLVAQQSNLDVEVRREQGKDVDNIYRIFNREKKEEKEKEEEYIVRVEMDYDVQDELAPARIEYNPVFHVWMSGNDDGLVYEHTAMMPPSSKQISFTIRSSEIQHDKAIEVELYTHSTNTQEEERGSIARRSAGIACFPLLIVLEQPFDEWIEHDLKTYGTNVICKGTCSLRLLSSSSSSSSFGEKEEEESPTERLLRKIKEAPVIIDCESKGAVRRYQDGILENAINCDMDDTDNDDGLLPLRKICANTLLPSVLSRAGPLLPVDYFSLPWNTAGATPPPEELWVRILHAILWECMPSSDEEILGYLLTYNATSRHYASDLVYHKSGRVIDVDMFGNIFVEGNGDCEDLTCDTNMWNLWLRKMDRIQHPTLQRVRNLLLDEYIHFSILADVTSPSVHSSSENEEEEEGAHMVEYLIPKWLLLLWLPFPRYQTNKTLLSSSSLKRAPPLVLEGTGRCNPLARGVDTKRECDLVRRTTMALGSDCNYYRAINVHTHEGFCYQSTHAKRLSNFYRYSVHGYTNAFLDTTGESEFVFVTGTADEARFGMAFEDFAFDITGATAGRHLLPLPPPPQDAILESRARKLHTHPVHVPSPSYEPPMQLLLPRVEEKRRIVIHAPIDNLTPDMTNRAIARLSHAGFTIGETRTVTLFNKSPFQPVGQHLIELFE